ncbi:MAG: TatD family hydrolase [Candidatus Harrisonbacteria bacterium]|nr:TatD family hydrolase [Candidatus Harrisonbacteria bacterium]
MLVVDTHAHVNFPDYDKDRNEVIKRALANNVWLINVGCDRKSSEESVELAQKYEKGVYASIALHPGNAGEEEFNPGEYGKLGQSERVVAIGETGLDYKGDGKGEMRDEDKEFQKEVFIKHLELARKLNKPVIIHCRKAHEDVLEILGDWQKTHDARLKGVAHSFLGNLKQARRYRELGFKIAFNGIITFARDYDKVILDTPLHNILIETDCPFLTPVPYRGQRNEPSYIIEVAKKIAEIKQVSLEKVVKITTENAKELFRI